MFLVKFYSYLNDLNALIFDIFIAGKYEAIAEITKEITNTIKIEYKLISLGNFSKKYMSDGNISKLNTNDRKALIFSILRENITPKITPVKVAKNQL